MNRMNRIQILLAVALGMPLGAWAQSYAYDDAGRLLRAVYRQGGGVAYSYDAADNITAVMPLATLPAPMEVQVTRLSDTAARVTWTADPDASSYVVERRSADGQWERVGTVSDGNVFTDDTLDAGVDYEYRVRAVNDDGESAPSRAATFGGPPAPSISQNGVLNGASFEVNRPIAPGSIISVFGDNLGIKVTETGIETVLALATDVPLSTELADYSLRFGNLEAPIFFVGGQSADDVSFTGQINAQVPWETPLGENEVSIVYSPEEGEEQTSDPQTVQVGLLSPALFTFDFGPGRAAGLNIQVDPASDVVNGSIVQPVNSFPGSPSQPAKLGGVVTLFANGLGPVDPPAVTGTNSLDALRGATVPVTVTVGGAEAQVLFAGLTPEFVGLYQINIIVPFGVVPGDEVPVVVTQGGLSSRSDVTIAVRP